MTIDNDFRMNATDEQLISEVKLLIRDENHLLAELLSRIAEIDERRLYARLGLSSMFAFMTSELHLSEDAAYKRITAARTARRFPMILDMVAKGEIHLSAIAILSPILSEENHCDILGQAIHRSKRDVERMHALYLPKPDIPDLVRRLPDASTRSGASAENGTRVDLFETAQSAETVPSTTDVRAEPISSAARRDRALPLSESRVKFQFTGSEELRSKLDRAKELLRHRYPEGKLEDIFDEALEALLEKRDPERRIARRRVGTPAKRSSSRTRRIPQRVKDVVWQRDEGRCQYVSPDGKRCEERGGLEYDHIVPWAMDGSSADPANIRLLCKTHNLLAACDAYGPEKMTERYTRGLRSRRAGV